MSAGRLKAAMRTDVVLQWRNKLYVFSVAIGIIIGLALAWLSPPDMVARTVPMALLMIIGGSTLMYVVAMVILERDDGTLSAVVVSPLRSWEYLASKVATLTGLAAIEGVLITAIGLALIARQGDVIWPNVLAVVGIVAGGAVHVLIGVLIVVRYDRLMRALIPMSFVALLLQLPAFYYVGALDSPVLLALPSAPPTMLVRGAFVPLEAWEWAYGLGGTAALLAGLGWWSLRAFDTHVVRRAG